MNEPPKRPALLEATMATIRLPERQLRPEIMPTDDDWAAVENEFEKLLKFPDATVQTVLHAYFDSDDKEVFIPEVECQTMANIQEGRSKLARALSWRFKDHQVTLATKFTMLWFGLPVEPVASAGFEPFRRFVSDFDDQGFEDVDVQPPLHFLMAHDQRNFGRDARRGRIPPMTTMPVPKAILNGTTAAAEGPQLRLRGGEISEDDSDIDMTPEEEEEEWDGHDDYVIEITSPTPEDPTMSGAQVGVVEVVSISEDNSDDSDDEDNDEDNDDANLSGADFAMVDAPSKKNTTTPRKNPIPQRVTIRSYQGSFELTIPDRRNIIQSFRQLLSLKPKESCDIVLLMIGSDGPDRVKRERTFPDPETSLEEAAGYIAANATDENSWFVHRIGEMSPERHPTPDARNTLVVRSEGELASRLSYLRLPDYDKFPKQGAPMDFGANDYLPFIHTTQDVLFGRAQNPRTSLHGWCRWVGYPPKKLPLKADKSAAPGKPDTSWTAWYGGLDVDEGFLAWAHQGNGARDTPVKVDVRIEQTFPKNRHVVFIVPGFKDQTSFTIKRSPGLEVGAVLQKLRKAALPEDNIRLLRVWHGTDLSSIEPDISRRYFEWDPNEQDAHKAEYRDAKLDQFIRRNMNHGASRGSYFTVQPLYRMKKLKTGGEGTLCRILKEALQIQGVFSEDLSSIKEFRSLIEEVNQGPVDWEKSSVVITPIYQNPSAWSHRQFVVSPRTRSKNLAFIRRIMAASLFKFKIVDAASTDFVRAMASEDQTVYGPRYGDIEPFRKALGLMPLPSFDSPEMTRLRKEHRARIAADVVQIENSLSEALASHGVASQGQKRKPPTTEPVTQKKTGLFGQDAADKPKRNLREESWSRPISLFENGPYNPLIPVNGPPVEKMLRVGNNFNVPVLSLGVLTPTEQHKLQKEVHELRNLNLARTSYCQFEDCNFSYRTDDVEGIRKHHKEHITYRCPWCPDVLFEHCDQEGRERHFKEKHAEELRRLSDEIVDGRVRNHPFNVESAIRARVSQEKRAALDPLSKLSTLYSKLHPRPPAEITALEAPAKAHKFEREFNYCDRCGRDHKYLTDPADRDVHDRLCVPHAEGAGAFDFCESCGLQDWHTTADRDAWEASARFPHKCKGFTHPGQPFCVKCGLSLDGFDDEYVDKHRKMCVGFRSEMVNFCPYCCESLIESPGHKTDHDEWIKNKTFHVRECRKRHVKKSERIVPGDMTPFDLYEIGYWGELKPPHDDLYHGPTPNQDRWKPPKFKATRELTHSLAWHDKQGPKTCNDPPDMCTVKDCNTPIFGLLPSDVLLHFEQRHGGLQKQCPFCELSFEVPMELRKDQAVALERKYQVLHVECHVFQLWDILHAGKNGKNGKKPPHGNPMAPGHPLREPFEEGMAPHLKRCPHFDDCGTIVGYMTPKQWELHLKKVHDGADPGFLPQPESLSAKSRALAQMQAQRQAQIHAMESLRKNPQHLKHLRRECPRESFHPRHPETRNQQPMPQASLPSDLGAQPTSAPKPSTQPSAPIASMQPAPPSIKVTLPGSPEPRRPAKPVSRPAPNDLLPSDSDGEASIPQTPSSALEPPEDLFVPKGDYWCSRCMRKAPQSAKSKNDPSVRQQITGHVLGTRSCKIGNGVGRAYDADGNLDLPNQSGWIAKSELPRNFSLSQHGKKWAKKHKRYANTIYPAQGGKSTQSSWKYDPNHDKNRAAWALPFPPPEGGEGGNGGDDDTGGDDGGETTSFLFTEDEGTAASSTWSRSMGPTADQSQLSVDGGYLEPGGEEAQDNTELGRLRRKNRGLLGSRIHDPLYVHRGEDDESTDEDINTPLDEEERSEIALSEGGASTTLKRKRLGTPSSKLSQEEGTQSFVVVSGHEDELVGDTGEETDRESAKRMKMLNKAKASSEKQRKKKKGDR